jgi:hypothetical protein
MGPFLACVGLLYLLVIWPAELVPCFSQVVGGFCIPKMSWGWFMLQTATLWLSMSVKCKGNWVRKFRLYFEELGDLRQISSLFWTWRRRDTKKYSLNHLLLDSCHWTSYTVLWGGYDRNTQTTVLSRVTSASLFWLIPCARCGNSKCLDSSLAI